MPRGSNAIDMTGQRFGRRIVLSRSSHKTASNTTYWDCICDCGNRGPVSGSVLRRGHGDQCNDCKFKDRVRDLEGQTFGNITVLRRSESRRSRSRVQWECVCACGSAMVVNGNALTTGNTTSCGCSKGSSRRIDLSGKTFGEWVVVHRDENRRGHWVTECTCGERGSVQGGNLTSGASSLCRKCSSTRANTKRHAAARLNRIEAEMFGDA